MIGEPLPLTTGDEAARLIRALGRHRYVASRLHLVHALVYAAIDPDLLAECPKDDLQEGSSWAARALSGPIDRASRDERLWRRANEAEVGALLEVYWSAPGASSRARLATELGAIGATLDATPFDEAAEDTMFPVLIDCGWSSCRSRRSIRRVTKVRSTRSVRRSTSRSRGSRKTRRPRAAIRPPIFTLSAIGPAELLKSVDETGALLEPLVLWNEGPEPYLSYVLRGALKSAKLA